MSLIAITAIAGCGGKSDDLQLYIDQVHARAGGRIEPLPEIKPYETFVYSAASLRSPFVPEVKLAASAQNTGPAPLASRNKEYLEQFPLDTLAMVGTLVRAGETFGLVQTKDGLVHRVRPGNYIGQNDGRIVVVTNSRIAVEELVPNGVGGYLQRDAAISLD